MTIKADKTFEEIVERIVALFRPQPEGATVNAGAQASSSSSGPLYRTTPPSTRTPSDEGTPN